MSRKGFTVTELLVVVAIIVILGALLMGGVQGCANNSPELTGVYQCVKTYTITSGGGDSTSTSKRVDVRPMDGGMATTFLCNDSWTNDIQNSATMYAQFEPGKWYQITTLGIRKEGIWNPLFPKIKAVVEIPDPRKPERAD